MELNMGCSFNTHTRSQLSIQRSLRVARNQIIWQVQIHEYMRLSFRFVPNPWVCGVDITVYKIRPYSLASKSPLLLATHVNESLDIFIPMRVKFAHYNASNHRISTSQKLTCSYRRGSKSHIIMRPIIQSLDLKRWRVHTSEGQGHTL